MTTLYHYTCEHGWASLGNSGQLESVAQQTLTPLDPAWWQFWYVWLTDLEQPDKHALGFNTTNPLGCDRTQFRYRVTDNTRCYPWADVRRLHTNAHLLEVAPGAQPDHWWISPDPVPVVLDLH